MGLNTPFSETERMKIRVLHGRGWSATRVAKELGRSVRGVSRVAAQMDLHFDHSQTEQATRAAAIDMRARRARVAERLLREAEDQLDDMHRPYTDHAFIQGGGVEAEERFTSHAAMPTPQDKAHLSRGAATLLAEHRKLAEFDADDGTQGARSLLGDLGKAIGRVAEQLEDD